MLELFAPVSHCVTGRDANLYDLGVVSTLLGVHYATTVVVCQTTLFTIFFLMKNVIIYADISIVKLLEIEF